jgi:N utilization substance protein B
MVENPESFPEQTDVAHLRESRHELAELRAEADGLSDAVLANRAELDARLAAVVENFSPARVDPVDRAILRLAAHEIFTAAVSPAVAKRYGSSDSGRFVNGVLDKLAKG